MASCTTNGGSIQRLIFIYNPRTACQWIYFYLYYSTRYNLRYDSDPARCMCRKNTCEKIAIIKNSTVKPLKSGPPVTGTSQNTFYTVG